MFASPGSRQTPGILSDKYNLLGPTTKLEKTVAQSVANNTFWVQINWDLLVRDDIGGIWSSNKPERLYVPQGIRMARFTFSWNFDSTAGNQRAALFMKNGSSAYADVIGSEYDIIGNFGAGQITTGFTPVNPGDYYSCGVFQNSGGALNFGLLGFGQPAIFEAEWAN